MTDNGPVAFDRRTGDALLAHLRQSNRQSTTSRSAPRPETSVGLLAWAKSSGTIGNGTWASPSTGKAQIYHGVTAVGAVVDVKNRYGGGTIPNDAALLLGFVDAEWWVVLAPCIT